MADLPIVSQEMIELRRDLAAARAAELELLRQVSVLTTERDSLRAAVSECKACVPIATAHRWLEKERSDCLSTCSEVADLRNGSAADCAAAIAARPAIGGEHG